MAKPSQELAQRDVVYGLIKHGADGESIRTTLGLTAKQADRHFSALRKQGRIERVSRGVYQCTGVAPPIRPGRGVPRSYLPRSRAVGMARKVLEAFVAEEFRARSQRGDPRSITTRNFDRAVAMRPIATDTALAMHDRAALLQRSKLLVEALKHGHAEFWRVDDTALLAYDEHAAPRMALLRDCQSNVRAILATGILTHGVGSIDNLALLAASWVASDRDLAAAGYSGNAHKDEAHIIEARSSLRSRGLTITKERVRNVPEMTDIDAARRLMADCGLMLWPERVDARAWYVESLGPVSGPTAVGLVARLSAIA
jgi:hypothetical protein